MEKYSGTKLVQGIHRKMSKISEMGKIGIDNVDIGEVKEKEEKEEEEYKKEDMKTKSPSFTIESPDNISNVDFDNKQGEQGKQGKQGKQGGQGKQGKQREQEPILRENPNRFCLFPIEKPRLFDLYKKQSAVFWFAEEVDLTKDLKDWDKLNADEQYFIKNVLGFFAGSDGIVQENLATRFMGEVQLPEARAFYAMQNAIESIHSEVYSLLIDQYIRDPAEKMKMFQAVSTVPCVAKKAKWAQKWIESDTADFGTRLIAFAIVEGIFFSGSFCSIFWLKERGLMPGLTFSNKLIARDEGLHMEFACELYREIVNKLTQVEVENIINEAVAIEKEFITDSLPVRLIGMNSDLMCKYIEYVADRLIKQLGYKQVFGTVNPFDFMERISMESRTNFFEHRVAEYAKAGVGKKNEDMVFSVDEEF